MTNWNYRTDKISVRQERKRFFCFSIFFFSIFFPSFSLDVNWLSYLAYTLRSIPHLLACNLLDTLNLCMRTNIFYCHSASRNMVSSLSNVCSNKASCVHNILYASHMLAMPFTLISVFYLFLMVLWPSLVWYWVNFWILFSFELTKRCFRRIHW